MALDLEPLAKLEQRLATRIARLERLDTLAAKGLRRRATRSRIILGGAILAELRENPDDDAFLKRIIALLDQRVSRGRDRDDLRELVGLPIPADPAPLSSSDDPAPPNFETLTSAVNRIPRSVVETDPTLADLRNLIDKSPVSGSSAG